MERRQMELIKMALRLLPKETDKNKTFYYSMEKYQLTLNNIWKYIKEIFGDVEVAHPTATTSAPHTPRNTRRRSG